MRQYGFYLFRVSKTAGGRLLYERIEADKSLVHELSRPRHRSVAIFHGITTDSISSGKPRPKPVFIHGPATDHRPIGGRPTGRETPAQPYYRPPPHAPARRQRGLAPRPRTPRAAGASPRHCQSPPEIQTTPPDLAPENGGRSMYCTPCGRQSAMAPTMPRRGEAPCLPPAHPHRAAPHTLPRDPGARPISRSTPVVETPSTLWTAQN